MPIQKISYFADLAFMPYGEKSEDCVIERTIFMTNFLLSQGVKTIVIACHTASSVALPTLRISFPHILFIDALLPTIDAAIQITQNNRVGIFATSRTIQSHLHKKLLLEKNASLTIVEQACPNLVPLLESYFEKDFEDKNVIETALIEAIKYYLIPMQTEKIDTLILGCTHYAFLEERIKAMAPELKLISADKYMKKLFMSSNKEIDHKIINFYSSAQIQVFEKQVERFCSFDQNTKITFSSIDQKALLEALDPQPLSF